MKLSTIIITGSWMAALLWWSGYLMWWRRQPMKQADYTRWLMFLAFILVPIAVACIFYLGSDAIFAGPATSDLSGLAVAALLFWSLAPALWFFVEYFAAVNGRIEPTTGNSKTFASRTRDYADVSAKVWAAFVVVYGVSVDRQIKSREADLKKIPCITPATARERLRHAAADLDRIKTTLEDVEDQLKESNQPR